MASVEKRQFDVDEMIESLREAVRPFPKAAMFELAQLFCFAVHRSSNRGTPHLRWISPSGIGRSG